MTQFLKLLHRRVGQAPSGSSRDHQVAKLVLGVAVNAPAGLRGIHVHHLGSRHLTEARCAQFGSDALAGRQASAPAGSWAFGQVRGWAGEGCERADDGRASGLADMRVGERRG